MALDGIGTMHIYETKATITIPTYMWKHDERFPFKDKQKLEVEIRDNMLIIRNPDKSKKKQQDSRTKGRQQELES